MARQQVYYRPLFVAWSMLNYTLFGLRPWGWHLGAVLAPRGGGAGRVLAGAEAWDWSTGRRRLAALIFALHPVHIEPVAWISAASDTMVTMFAALAFAAFLNGRDPAQDRRDGMVAGIAGAAGVRAADERNGGQLSGVGGDLLLAAPGERKVVAGAKSSWSGDGGGTLRRW